MDNAGGGSGSAPGGGLQFDQVELAAEAQRACKRCKRVTLDEYFESAGNILCRPCADELGAGGGKASDFLRALAYGGAAAILGTIIWLTVIKISNGSEYGIIAIGVGLLIGFAVRKGSLGRGGRKYQVLAIALTYVSITSSYVPYVLHGVAEGAKTEAKPGDSPGEPAPDQAGSPSRDEAKPITLTQWMIFFVMVFGIAFISPFLAGFSNVLGFIIIGIALFEAWKMNRLVPISGPYRLGAPARAGPAALVPPSS